MPPSNPSSLARLGTVLEKLSLFAGQPTSKRRTLILAGVVTLVATSLWVPRLKGPIDLRWDAGVYYDLGASLAAGEGYRIRTEPGNPVGVQYPPGLPAIVALHILVLGTDNPETAGSVMRFTFAGFFLAYGLASLALARRILPDAWALVATILMLFQGYALVMSNLLFTEIPFVLISVCLILLIDGKEEKPSTWKKDGLAFLLATAGFALRSAGVVLLIAWPLAHLLHGRWRRSLITSLMAVIPVLLWQLHVKSVQQSREYQEPAYAYQRAPYQFYNVPYAENALLVDPFTPELGEINKLTLIKRMFSNALDIPLAFGESTCTVYGYCLWAIERTQDYFLGKVLVPGQAASKLLVVIGLSAFIGCLLVAWKHYYVLGLVVVGTAGLVCMTPWPGQFARYLVPIVPFVAIGHTTFIKESVFWILKLLGHPGGKGQLIAVPPFALVLLLQVYGITKIYASNELPGNSSDKWSESMFYYDKFWDNWQKASVWIVSDASPGDIVATISSHYFFLQTGMKAVYPPMEVDPEKARRLMEEVPIRYFIADETVHLDVARRYGLPAMESNPENWQLVFQIDETRVFKNTGIK